MGQTPFLSAIQHCHGTEGNTKYWSQPVAWPHPFFIHHRNTDGRDVVLSDASSRRANRHCQAKIYCFTLTAWNWASTYVRRITWNSYRKCKSNAVKFCKEFCVWCTIHHLCTTNTTKLVTAMMFALQLPNITCSTLSDDQAMLYITWIFKKGNHVMLITAPLAVICHNWTVLSRSSAH